MMEIASLFLWPFLAVLAITAIHAYLGLHVVERDVIFVDLSLAQVAALGAAVAVLMGMDLHGGGAYMFSLGFALLGAVFFSLTRTQEGKVPQEAVIGIVYAVSAAAAVMIMDRLPEGAEHLKHIMVGNLLAVSPADVVKMALLYIAIGAVHWIWRRPLLLISTDPAEARRRGLKIWLWDFLFYGTFGVVVTVSVPIAGVLLVFSYLIVPSVAALLFTDKVGGRLAIGWGMSAGVSLLGLAASYWLDAPTGATIVCVFGAMLACAAAARRIFAG
ncbi:MAG: iron chelate uptake ABC transporter family permease subunit [Elusimicrobiota bacterium]